MEEECRCRSQVVLVDEGEDVDQVSLAAGHVAESGGGEDGPVGRPEGRHGHREGHQPGEHAQRARPKSLWIHAENGKKV